jgi:formate hydrogenlyase subunit 3/multisubunit Na+/H+ antiporter MnhD subunit
MDHLERVLHVIAILSIGVVYGVDVFFMIIGRKALSRSSDAAMTEVIGRIHEVADKRMPIFGAVALVSTLALAGTQWFNSAPASALALACSLTALIAQVVFLVLYSVVSKPVNVELTRAAQTGRVPANARLLQNRWDRVIPLRASLLLLTLFSLTISI